MRCRCPADRERASGPSVVSYPSGSRRIISFTSAARAAAMTALLSRTSSIREMLSDTEPVSSSTSCGKYPMCRPNSSGDHLSSAAPSSLTCPRARPQTPVIARARLDLPAALGPMMPTASPASISRDTLFTTIREVPGIGTVSPSRTTLRAGAGRRSGSGSGGSEFNVAPSRAKL